MDKTMEALIPQIILNLTNEDFAFTIECKGVAWYVYHFHTSPAGHQTIGLSLTEGETPWVVVGMLESGWLSEDVCREYFEAQDVE
jgi:hypothetical protein